MFYYSAHVAAWHREKERLARFLTGEQMAEVWERWCGKTAWSKAARRFGELGGVFEDFGGMPRCASAIPLTFALHHQDGRKFDCLYRLKDIKGAIALLESEAA